MSSQRAVVWITEGTWTATVDAAAALAEAATMEIVLLHIVDVEISEALHGAFGGLLGRHSPSHDPGGAVADLADAESEQLLAAAADRLGHPSRREVRSGRVEREVVAACQGASLLVCARDGDHSRLGPHSLGPTTRFVVDHAPCAVLLIWPDRTPDIESIPPPPPAH
ncbi:universal stress protein [Pseudonocardia spinosispora]|uniref:universal stress protein n=1 Tax=Pseudonocardia spinosispora TaxID=103441 RepID=UPI0004068966|nr:universal stress protein [Pseudonocardia spinosispora]